MKGHARRYRHLHGQASMPAGRWASELPALPAELPYSDEYTGEARVLRHLSEQAVWHLDADGTSNVLDFSSFQDPLCGLLKRWAVWALRRSAVSTVCKHQLGLRRLHAAHGADSLLQCLSLSPMQLRERWYGSVLPEEASVDIRGLKSLLHFASEHSIGQLKPGHADFIGGLRGPTQDKYAAVRAGEVFLRAREEALLVDYFDELNGRLAKAPKSVTPIQLRDSCVLLASYQYGFRPLQIAKVRLSDVRLYELEGLAGPAVHVTFATVKQRWSATVRPLTRAVKREWSPMFVAFLSYRQAHASEFARARAVSLSLFGLTPPEVSKLIQTVTRAITGIVRSANELRHTAAQRLADAGAAKEELMEFMGHASAETGLVYFDSSPTQAARVNKALGLSPIYTAVVQVARSRTIDKAALLGLPPDMQIGGSPHGVPIAGIGACVSGQSLCVKNPVLSCYGCRKFMPIRDPAMHRMVLEGLRPVVHQFFAASRGEAQGPAYAQLTRTLAAVQAVVDSVGGKAS